MTTGNIRISRELIDQGRHSTSSCALAQALAEERYPRESHHIISGLTRTHVRTRPQVQDRSRRITELRHSPQLVLWTEGCHLNREEAEPIDLVVDTQGENIRLAGEEWPPGP